MHAVIILDITKFDSGNTQYGSTVFSKKTQKRRFAGVIVSTPSTFLVLRIYTDAHTHRQTHAYAFNNID